MRQLKKFLCFKQVNVFDYMNVSHVERLICSMPVLRSLPSNCRILSVSVRLYSSNNHSHTSWTRTTFLQSHIGQNKSLQITPRSLYSTANDSEKGSLTESKSSEEAALSTSVVQKVKETSETMFWMSIIVFGFTFAVCVAYAIASELFSENSAHCVYSKAVEYISKDERVLNELGDQIKGFGEETRRGRRRHVSHIEYSKEGRDYLRMKFYVKGSRGRGTVHLEMIKNDKGNYEYRYMFLIIDSSIFSKTIILEDNRGKHESGDQIGKAFDSRTLEELDLSTGSALETASLREKDLTNI